MIGFMKHCADQPKRGGGRGRIPPPPFPTGKHSNTEGVHTPHGLQAEGQHSGRHQGSFLQLLGGANPQAQLHPLAEGVPGATPGRTPLCNGPSAQVQQTHLF